MDKQSKHRLPQQCLFMNANGEIMSIEYGKSGFSRSELSTENRKANREIVNSYNERHGITAEQVKMMHSGALHGWDTLHASHSSHQQESSVKNGCIFEIEISRPGSFGAETSATLSLPATPYELLDALDKARVTDERVIYSSEILNCELDYLPQFISTNTNLYELNHLAHRLSSLSEWEKDCFEGLVMMDTIQTSYAPIGVDRLINMTHSTEDCQLVYEAHDDRAFGKFYADNDFVPKLENVPDEIYECLDFGKIGKEMREGEGGVFTPHGYVLQNGEISQTYHSGDAIPLEKPDYTVLLRVTKGYFNDPEYDNDLTALLKLPATDEELYRAVEKAGAASPKECSFTAMDCSLPWLTEKITDHLEETDGGGYDLVNELAEQLQKLNGTAEASVCKAMLKSAPEDIPLENALDLAYQASEFRLLREIASPADYAKAELAKCTIPLKEELLQSQNLYRYGEKLMEQNKAVSTDYGILYSPAGQTVEQCLPHPGQHMEMR